MKILAIDTSCDESCAAVVDTETWRLLSNVVYSHVLAMEKYGGIVPEIASREHLKILPLAVSEALDSAKLKVRDLDWIAITNRPGLIGALLVGVSFGKAMAFALRRPFSVFNHVEAHLYSALLPQLDGATTPRFPWVTLVVSGGHTELFYVEKEGVHHWLGGTLDDAAGEAFDKIGKLLNLPYPAGPKMDQWVREMASPEHRTHFQFPRSDPKAHSFSFSGLKTAVSYQLAATKLLSENLRLSFAASAQEAIVDALTSQLRKSSKQFPGASLVVTGGVACNSRLREKLPEAYFPSPRYCTDNAAMVGLLAALEEKRGALEPSDWNTTAYAISDES